MNRYSLIPFLLLLLACSRIVTAQNHIPNPSFEEHTGCPNGPMQVGLCKEWMYVVGTPDYYHTCGSGDYHIPNIGFGPNGIAGYQTPAHGNAYMGFQAYNPNHFEYITAPIQPLTPGQKYEVSMSVNLMNWSSLATDNIGVFFSIKDL